jgi:drug/metabolite transporter (DMT)-like permease
MPFDFIRLPLIAVIGALAYGEPIDPYVLCGGVMIFLGIWISIRSELQEQRIST